MRFSVFSILLLPVFVSACTPTVGVSRNAPFGVDARGEAVDGLLVGHRLMVAGEYELALKAYYRAEGEQGRRQQEGDGPGEHERTSGVAPLIPERGRSKLSSAYGA